MPKLIAMGELLIDFIPNEKNIPLKDVFAFSKAAGGAPANVAACVAKLGYPSKMITKLGTDAFGDYLVETLDQVGVDTSSIVRTDEANTALAFVSLRADGERDFSFYRNPSADMLLSEEEIQEEWFEPGDILHFCSVDLIEAPVKYAHLKAIEYALKHQCIISFDPNLRFPLWKDLEVYHKTLQEFLPLAHILKISTDELEFITRIQDQEEAIQSLFQGNVKVVLLTDGAVGATVYTKKHSLFVPTLPVKAVDTTGAGDSFIGGILYQVLARGIPLAEIERVMYRQTVLFAHRVSRIVVSRYGAIPAMPSLKEVDLQND
ncbi:MAG: carbohydrate kinase [Candidatus Izemoplasmatales bacterium]|nr:carbohydrate kinase [Candidatus Izemoplasmatales bacterium]